MATENKGSITIAILWMLFISVLLFWLPVIGPLIAGLVGGKKADRFVPPVVDQLLAGKGAGHDGDAGRR